MFNFLQDIAIGATPPPSLSSRYLSIVASGGGGGGAKILQKIMTPPLSVIKIVKYCGVGGIAALKSYNNNGAPPPLCH